MKDTDCCEIQDVSAPHSPAQWKRKHLTARLLSAPARCIWHHLRCSPEALSHSFSHPQGQVDWGCAGSEDNGKVTRPGKGKLPCIDPRHSQVPCKAEFTLYAPWPSAQRMVGWPVCARLLSHARAGTVALVPWELINSPCRKPRWLRFTWAPCIPSRH